MTAPLDRRPIVVALAGPNGAGKSTFYHAHLAPSGLRFVNADQIAAQLRIGPYQAAELAGQIRTNLVARRESFVFETVFSDPVGDKLAFLKEAERNGYTVVLIFIGIEGPIVSQERVAMRVAKGGHDVPDEKLMSRYGRTMENLRRALACLANVYVYDNSNLAAPYRLVVRLEDGMPVRFEPVPAWLASLLPVA
jgi:predicted ABC-type ATPase